MRVMMIMDPLDFPTWEVMMASVTSSSSSNSSVVSQTGLFPGTDKPPPPDFFSEIVFSPAQLVQCRAVSEIARGQALESVAYHQALAVPYVVGERVRSLFQNDPQQAWFEAVITAKVDACTYAVRYLDGTIADEFACRKDSQYISSLVGDDESVPVATITDLSGATITDLSCSEYDSDWDSEDDADNSSDLDEDADLDFRLFTNCRRSAAKSKPTRKLSHDELAKTLETEYGIVQIENLRQKRSTAHHEFRPVVPRGSTLVRFIDPEGTFLGRKRVVVVRQILQDPVDRSRFQYVIKSPPQYESFLSTVWEPQLLCEIQKGSARVINIPSNKISMSTTDKDIFLLPTKDEMEVPFPPMLDRYCVKRVGDRAVALHKFGQRYQHSSEIRKHRRMLEDVTQILTKYPVKAERPQWKQWNPFPTHDYRHRWFHYAVCQFSMSNADVSLKEPLLEFFKLKSSNKRKRRGGERGVFDNPQSVAREPSRAYAFFATRRTNSTKDDGLDDAVALQEGTGATKSVNLWRKKIRSLILNAKRLCVFAVVRLRCEQQCVDASSRQDFDRVLLQVMEEFKLETILEFGSLLPLPDKLLLLVPTSTCLLPGDWDDTFFRRLYNFGVKCRNLMAESCYGLSVVSGCGRLWEGFDLSMCLGVFAILNARNGGPHGLGFLFSNLS